MSVFTHLVLTAPGGESTRCYEDQLSCLDLGSVQTMVVSDPQGERIGSGGGSFNALATLRERIGRDELQTSRVLIIHSGGDSRRAPFHSVCGKAWSTMSTDPLSCPLKLLINEISELCSFGEQPEIKAGGVVIASSDVLLDLTSGTSTMSTSRSSSLAANAITVVAVPEYAHTAHNHGVLVPSTKPTIAGLPLDVSQYLQKPSIEVMSSSCAFSLSGLNNGIGGTSDSANKVWIDTGVVAATGQAYRALLELLDDSLVSRCTSLGNKRSRRLTKESTVPYERLELYSDILLACQVNGEACDLSEYYGRLGVPPRSDPGSDPRTRLWCTLRNIPLYMTPISEGIFSHLGTSAELLDLLSEGSRDLHDSSKAGLLGRKYGLCAQVGSSGMSTWGLILNSYIYPTDHTSKQCLSEGQRLIEHSCVAADVCRHAHPQDKTIVSHIGPILGEHLKLQPNIMVQQVYLRGHGCKTSLGSSCGASCPPRSSADRGHERARNLSFATICLDIYDDIKASFESKGATICGAPWEQLFQVTGLRAEHIWPDGTEQSLWHARVFPVATECEDTSNGAMRLFLVESTVPQNDDTAEGNYVACSAAATQMAMTWLQHLRNIKSTSVVSEDFKAAIQAWNSVFKVSLAQILSLGDNLLMHRWRGLLRTAISCGHCETTGINKPNDRLRKCLPSLLRAYVEITSCSSWRKASSILEIKHDKDGLGSEPRHILRVLLLSLWCVRLSIAPANAHTSTITLALQTSISQIATCYSIVNSAQLLLLQKPFERLWDLVLDAEASEIMLDWLISDAKECKYGLVVALHAILGSIHYVPASMQPRMFFILGYISRSVTSPLLPMPLLTGDKSERGSFKEYGVRLASHLKSVLPEVIGGNLKRSNGACSSDKRYTLTDIFESQAQALIAMHCHISLAKLSSPFISNVSASLKASDVVICTAPARIDLAGGWSDTPPICYESPGVVLNVGVKVDARNPLICFTRKIEKPIIKLSSIKKLGDDTNSASSEDVIISDYGDILDFTSPDAPAALLKACLLAMNVIDPYTKTAVFHDQLMTRFGGGIEVACVSLLPAGSGMGGSSILATTIISALARLLCRDETEQDLIYHVSLVEQLLTTGGGWQDQCGCLSGGFKLSRSTGCLPMGVLKTVLSVSPQFSDIFSKYTYLVYTGVPRLAKNTLINALRKHSLQPLGLVSANDIVNNLVREAEETYTELLERVGYVETNNFNNLSNEKVVDTLKFLGEVVSRYWKLKTRMAPGSDPPHVSTLLDSLRSKCCGIGLCGAGAGGFAVCILSPDKFKSDDIHMEFKSIVHDVDPKLSVHRVQVDNLGITTELAHYEPAMSCNNILRKHQNL